MKKRIPTIIGILLLISSAQILAAVRAWVNAPTVYVGDPVTLTIETDNQNAPRPDLTPLKNSFQILGTGTSTSVSIVNGRSSSKKSWRITLQPLGQGKLTIPSINVGGEKTAPLTITVSDIPEQVKAKLRNHVILEASVDSGSKPAYVQQQIGYTVKLLTDDDVISGELIPPQIENAIIEQVDEDKRYQVTRNGKTFNVIERHYVISPERSGRLNIPPVQFRGKLRDPRKSNSRSRDPFDAFSNDDFFRDPFGRDFFDDDFFRNPFGNRGKPIRTSSNSISIEVLPVPKDYKGKNWLPAEAVRVEDSWATLLPTFKVGEPVVRSLRIQAKGLSGSQMPPIDVPEPEGMRVYADPAKTSTLTDGETVYGVSEQSITYIPNKAGKITIPEIKIDWWNTRTGKQETTTIPARTVEVKPGAGGITQSATPQPAKAANTGGAKSKETKSGNETETQQKEASTWNYWLIGIIALTLLALLWLLTKHKNRQQPKPDDKEATTPPAAPTINKRAIRQALQQACEKGDAQEAAKQLIEFAKAEWPNDPPTSLGALAKRLEKGREEVFELDRYLYGAQKEKWDGQSLCAAIKDGFDVRTQNESSAGDGVQSLYPERD